MSNKSDNSKSKNNLTQDNYGMEYLFLRMFFENTDLYYEFPIIAHEYLTHEIAYLDDYHDIDYGADTPKEAPKTLYINVKVLGLMYQAAKKGSEYSRNFLVYLYKTYYTREHNSLKGLKVLNSKDALGLTKDSKDDSYNEWRLPRIFAMAPFLGVELGDTAYAYSIIEKSWNTIYHNKCECLEKTIPEDLMDECADQVLDWMDANEGAGIYKYGYR